MSTQTEDSNNPETPIFDPFPEPKTMPTGWDLSALVSAPVPVSSTSTEAFSSTDKK